MLEDYNEYIVDELSGKSSSPGNPDRIANMVLEKWGLIPKGDNSADSLFTAAVPSSRFVGCYRLKVLKQQVGLQAWLHRHESGEDSKLDFGPVLMGESQLANGKKVFVVEGNYLSKITIHCRSVLEEVVPEPCLPQPVEAEPEILTTIQPLANQVLPIVVGAPSVAELLDIPVNRIRRNREQPRQKFNANDLLLLGHSMRDSGQTDRIEVIRISGDPDADFELVKGERRWRAASLVGISILKAIVLSHDQIPDKNVQHSVCLISDLHHSRYTDIEVAFALARQKAVGNKTLQQLATMCKKKSVAWVSQHLAITHLHPDLLKLLNPDLPRKQQMSFSIAWRIARLNPVEQVEVYSQVSKIKGAKLQVIETDKLVAQLRPGESWRKKTVASDSYANLGSIVPRMLADVVTAEGYPGDVFLSLVQHRPPDEIGLVLEQIEKIKVTLGGLQSKIISARKKWRDCQTI